MKATAIASEESCVTKLAQFFPEAIPMRIPVRASRPGVKAAEATIIEFGTPQEVLFTSCLPLDFEDHVRLENSDGSLVIEAEVIAMQLHQGKTAIAARFLKSVTNWIIKK